LLFLLILSVKLAKLHTQNLPFTEHGHGMMRETMWDGPVREHQLIGIQIIYIISDRPAAV